MRVPILYALSHPRRLKSDLPRLELKNTPLFTFLEPDLKKFRCLSLAFQVLNEGGNMPCIMNAANEIAVTAFLSGKIGFMQIPDVVEYTIGEDSFISSPGLEELEISDRQARVTAGKFINKLLNEK